MASQQKHKLFQMISCNFLRNATFIPLIRLQKYHYGGKPQENKKMLQQKLFWLHFVLNWVSFKDRDDIHFFLFFPFFLIGGKRSILYIFCMGGNLKRSFDSKTWSVAGWVKSLLLKSEEISWQTLSPGLVGSGEREEKKIVEKTFCSLIGFTIKTFIFMTIYWPFGT